VVNSSSRLSAYTGFARNLKLNHSGAEIAKDQGFMKGYDRGLQVQWLSLVALFDA
jgi:hypothetical protein